MALEYNLGCQLSCRKLIVKENVNFYQFGLIINIKTLAIRKITKITFRIKLNFRAFLKRLLKVYFLYNTILDQNTQIKLINDYFIVCNSKLALTKNFFIIENKLFDAVKKLISNQNIELS